MRHISLKYSARVALLLLTALNFLPAEASDFSDRVVRLADVGEVCIVEQEEISAPTQIDMTPVIALKPYMSKGTAPSIYELPYSLTGHSYHWKRLWTNTTVLASAFVGTLFVLECLPEDATTWNRAALQKDPPQTRWFRNIFKKGPEWDHDNPIFNFVLHPYAGAAYFMAARSCGFNYWQSLLYSATISTVGWEFGIEACMERPSIQDIFITPIVGSVFGELFYKLKRHIVANDYHLFGSPVIGNIVAFFIDPVNEVVGYFAGNPERKLHLGRKAPQVTSSLMPTVGRNSFGFAFTCVF